MKFDTFALRFSKHGDKTAKRIIYLIRHDFSTPQDAFYEGEIGHWENLDWRKETWGNIAGPMDLCLCPEQYDEYARLVEECKDDFMATIIDRKAQELIEKGLP